MVEEARRLGFRAGRDEGYAAGVADSVASETILAAAVERGLAAVAEAQREVVAGSIDLALVIAEFILGRAVHDGGAALASHVAAAISSLDDTDLEITVHADDHGIVERTPSLSGARILVDQTHTLEPGEARIRGRWSSVDLTRTAAFDVVREVLG